MNYVRVYLSSSTCRNFNYCLGKKKRRRKTAARFDRDSISSSEEDLESRRRDSLLLLSQLYHVTYIMVADRRARLCGSKLNAKKERRQNRRAKIEKYITQT